MAPEASAYGEWFDYGVDGMTLPQCTCVRREWRKVVVTGGAGHDTVLRCLQQSPSASPWRK